MLSHQGFGDAAADGVNLGRETTALYLHMHDHAPLSPARPEWLLVAQKQIQVQHLRLFVASCFTSVRFAVSLVCSGSFLASEDLQTTEGL